MTVTAASRWAMLLCAMMLAVIVTLAIRWSEHLAAVALPAAIVVMTIGLEFRITRTLRSVPDDQRGNAIPALLIHLLLLIPCIGLAGLLVAFD